MFEGDPPPHLAVLSILVRMPQRCGRQSVRIKYVSPIELDEDERWGSYLVTPTRGAPKLLHINHGVLRKVPRKQEVYSCRFLVPPERLRIVCAHNSERELWMALLAILPEGTETLTVGEERLFMGYGKMWMCLLGPRDMDELGLLESHDASVPLPESVFIGLTVTEELPEAAPHRVWSSLRKGKKQKGSRENPLLIPRESIETWLCGKRYLKIIY